jgi:single-stranded DNA-binding protein
MGSLVRAIGSLQTRSWEDCECERKRFKTVVWSEDVIYLVARYEPRNTSEAAEEVAEEPPFSSSGSRQGSHGKSSAPIHTDWGAWRCGHGGRMIASESAAPIHPQNFASHPRTHETPHKPILWYTTGVPLSRGPRSSAPHYYEIAIARMESHRRSNTFFLRRTFQNK